MKIDKNTTIKIAKLSRLKLDNKEIDELSIELSTILDWVEQLNEVDTNNIEPLSNVSSAELPLRKDLEESQNNSENVLSNAPEKLENYFVVPKVVE
ncbi:MAG: Glutamyl-tRNA(Gln) amidotransferase subunit C [Alphaproteobacteria bacterium MarineAlpha5_Bin9]|nr:MAG: Glutamyl-tRNA(Gln) amidotransferase subunit C [Alphaproteobacteria bacterium MarineAlpha5_Bin9]|tara:strand:+ start:6051 stop:6338 length:288 start_codon:yes stop_codon:yes gene_type:complete